MENSMELPQNTKHRGFIWSSNPTPGHISRQDYNLKRVMYFNVHNTLFAKARHRNNLNVHWQMDKEDGGYTHNGALLNHKKEWNIAIYNNVDGPRDDHTK